MQVEIQTEFQRECQVVNTVTDLVRFGSHCLQVICIVQLSNLFLLQLKVSACRSLCMTWATDRVTDWP